MPESSPLFPCLIENYSGLKLQYPTEGRRRWRLRVAQQFWSSVQSAKSLPLPLHGDVLTDVTVPMTANFVTDNDPLDVISSQLPQLGLILRTDFSDQNAWLAFCARLQEGEKEFAAESDDRGMQEAPDQGNSDDEDDEDPPPIFHLIDPTSPQERESLAHISNLTALHLFNDVDVRSAPSPPQGTRRISPPNRLVDRHGWQEIYLGKNIWIYDTKSNVDQCVRVVSQSADMYGTATGDSWRARVSHICELQVNLFSGSLKIDFGGLDRWDSSERQRNMKEAERD
ncbi:hypothetical protein PAXRUDRAFT_823642 [Paxillus rubicundulus Ve08.2h10]|uniref:Uncharacterized protein n=1 Tax=Paxillus rubicundulus Ve08.2h10 TaxID=930991 RepID=A0A0D0E3B1_9AGAM|nr:hypothetical protein PAXRUDRAFT_823642 [Paxillus rubicundulus Ve08.2h10]